MPNLQPLYNQPVFRNLSGILGQRLQQARGLGPMRAVNGIFNRLGVMPHFQRAMPWAPFVDQPIGDLDSYIQQNLPKYRAKLDKYLSSGRGFGQTGGFR